MDKYRAFQQQIEMLAYRAGQRVFHGNHGGSSPAGSQSVKDLD